MHYSDVTWTLQHLKSPASWLFVQQLVQLTYQKTPRLHITGPVWGESTSHHWIPLTKGQWYGKCSHVMMSSVRKTAFPPPSNFPTQVHSVSVNKSKHIWHQISSINEIRFTDRNPDDPQIMTGIMTKITCNEKTCWQNDHRVWQIAHVPLFTWAPFY